MCIRDRRDAESNQLDLTISVAQHVLGLTDQFLKGQGIADANLQTERSKRFRQWVSQHTLLNSDGKPSLVFDFSTSSASNGPVSYTHLDVYKRQKLDAAKYQFDLTQQGLREALDHRLGSGCLVSDFYTQSEWALLSRAVQGQERCV